MEKIRFKLNIERKVIKYVAMHTFSRVMKRSEVSADSFKRY
jgi:hypothetical protein